MQADAKIVKTGKAWKILAGPGVYAFWIVMTKWVEPTDENPWVETSATFDLGDRYLLEIMPPLNEPWTFNGPAFQSDGEIIGAACQGPTGAVEFK